MKILRMTVIDGGKKEKRNYCKLNSKVWSVLLKWIIIIVKIDMLIRQV